MRAPAHLESLCSGSHMDSMRGIIVPRPDNIRTPPGTMHPDNSRSPGSGSHSSPLRSPGSGHSDSMRSQQQGGGGGGSHTESIRTPPGSTAGNRIINIAAKILLGTLK